MKEDKEMAWYNINRDEIHVFNFSAYLSAVLSCSSEWILLGEV